MIDFKPPILMGISDLSRYRRLNNTPTYFRGFRVQIGRDYEHKSFHLNKPDLQFCKYNNMTPPKKDSYSQGVARSLQNVIFGSQIALSGHKNMDMSIILLRESKRTYFQQAQ